MNSLDKSFLRLLTDFSLAKSEIMIDSEFIYNSPICLHPLERYLQITNLNEYGFDELVIEKVELIDCNENLLLNIDDKVYYTNFYDINDFSQIAFEILPIQNDFYFQKCYLKFTFENDIKLYSNGFYVTAEEENKTFRLDYKNIGYYQGISYDKVELYQSIRLLGYFDQPSTKDSVTIYTQLNGQVRRSRPIQGLEYKYNIDLIDTFTFERLSCALNSQIVYLNGNRFQTIDNVQSEERQGKSNMFSTSFKGQFNYNDTYVDQNQIKDIFNYIDLYPFGVYSPNNLPNTFLATFNQNVQSVEYIKLFNGNTNALIENLTIYPISANEIEGNLPTLGLGKYYITFKCTSNDNEVLEVVNKTWNFTIKTGDYNISDYNPNFYLI